MGRDRSVRNYPGYRGVNYASKRRIQDSGCDLSETGGACALVPEALRAGQHPARVGGHPLDAMQKALLAANTRRAAKGLVDLTLRPPGRVADVELELALELLRIECRAARGRVEAVRLVDRLFGRVQHRLDDEEVD